MDIRDKMKMRRIEENRLKSNIENLLINLDSLSDEEIKKMNIALERKFSKISSKELEDLNKIAEKIFGQQEETER